MSARHWPVHGGILAEPSMNYTLLGFLLYLLAILVVGFVTYRFNKSHYDFFLASRKLNPWVVAFSERASGESAWVLLGLPGAAYTLGLLEFWSALGCVLGIVAYWLVVARKLREQSEELGSITLPDFFARKFEAMAFPIRLVALSIILFFFIFYLAAQFSGAGKVLNVTFGIPSGSGIVIGAAVIVFYTMMGGFFAVAWTDLIQGIIMLGALVLLPLAGFIQIMEEHKGMGEAIRAQGPVFASFTGGREGWAAAAVIVNGLSWGLGYFGQPHLLVRFMSIDNPKNIRISRRIAYAWAIPAFAGAFLTGLVGLTYYGAGAFPDAEAVLPALAQDLLPAWLAGILVSGAIAAMMSTADSQLLTATSSVIEDFYHKTLHRKTVTTVQLLQAGRAITLVVGVFALAIALTSTERIYQMVSYAWGGLGASFGPAMVLALWWRGTRPAGILAGMLCGSLVTFFWTSQPGLEAWMSGRLVAWVAALLAIVFFSLLFRSPFRSTRF
jgi:sodium/proline symporter